MNASAKGARPKILIAVVGGCAAVLLGSCSTTGTGSGTLPITPMCTILCEVGATSTVQWNGQVFVSERTDPTVGSGFRPLRPMSNPRGDPAIGFTNSTGIPNTYAISEAWLRFPGAPVVFRAQATPKARTTSGAGPDFFGSGWVLQAQDAFGAWSGVFGTGSANRGDEADPPDVAALTVPRLMPVGVTTLHMFACAGGRAENNGSRTTWLIEATAPNAAAGITGGIVPIQDAVNGDNYFVPNKQIVSAPLAPPTIGPPSPPTPTIAGPGDQSGNGSVLCAMTQLDDNVATRELHMLAIRNGVLYHSMASNFGPVTDGNGVVSSRFGTVSGWGDVTQALGGGFGNISSAAIVAHPTSISVFFMAASGGGRYRLWHAVRFSSGGGSWRPAADVLALSGDAVNGTVYPLNIAAGVCPELSAAVWDATTTETLVALWGGSGPGQVLVIRVVRTPRQWTPSVTGLYSPWQSVGFVPPDSFNNPFLLRNVVVAARPFPHP